MLHVLMVRRTPPANPRTVKREEAGGGYADIAVGHGLYSDDDVCSFYLRTDVCNRYVDRITPLPKAQVPLSLRRSAVVALKVFVLHEIFISRIQNSPEIASR
jgi:hypothetical protein